jgi:cytochrome c-type biogenesis protein CcmF
VLLALFAFSLSLLGTFLVRSGVLTSVHAFATDPTRGTFILIFLCLVIGGSLALYAWRAPSISSGGRFDLLSRETFLLANNLLLSLFCAMVLFGTLAPLIYEAMGWGKISVGFPWFNAMFVILMPFLAFFMGIGPVSRWKTNDAAWLVKRLWWAFAISLGLALAALWPSVNLGQPLVPLGIGLAAWVVLSLVVTLRERYRHRRGLKAVLADLSGNGRSYYGMLLAHLGVAMFIVGATMVSNFGVEEDVRMSPGDSQEIEGYRFQFEGVTSVPGPNYRADQGRFLVFDGDEQIAVLKPEKRVYLVQTRPMTEAAINAGLMRDLYVSLGEPLGGGDWSMRLYYKPYVRWIWLGAIFMGLGGLLAVTDRRYRSARRAKTAVAPDRAATT